MSTIEIKFSRIATESEIKQRRRETLAYLRHVEEPEDIELDEEHIRYLKAVRDYPDMRAGDRDELLGYDRLKLGGKQTKIRKRLGKGNDKIQGLNLIREEMINPPGRGNGYTKLVMTENGLRFLQQLEIGREIGRTSVR